LLKIQGTSLVRALNGKSIILVFGRTHELKMTDNKIIALSTKMVDEAPWPSPSGEIWSKTVF
jgi:hypothetical protein